MADLIYGAARRPLVPGRSLFDDAAELSMYVPASCQRSGRCHECVVEIRSGEDQLTSRTPSEEFLGPGYRLACMVSVARTEEDVEISILRRQLRIELASDTVAEQLDVDPMVSVVQGHYRGSHGADLGVSSGPPLGLAIDVGTTTVVLELVALDTGVPQAVSAIENPQRFGGSDVISRIAYDGVVPGELRQALRRALNHELRRLYSANRVDRRQVVDAYVVGNSTMRDLFFGLDVAPLGRLPYRSQTEVDFRSGASRTTAVSRLAHELGLLINPRASVTGGPLVASHVGADVTADLAAIERMVGDGPFLLLDIGTNSEIVASDGTRLVAASGPAGPAFEGGGVRHGMPGAVGAIEHVQIDEGQLRLRTIGGAPAEGICGTGLVDLLAELRRGGLMTLSGGFADGSSEMVVEPTRPITFTRADVAHLAIAKAATAVGQHLLLRHLGLVPADLERVFLAGGFGNAIDAASAIDIGLVVPVSEDRVVRAGNASIAGARSLLVSQHRRDQTEALVRNIEHVELEAEPDFIDVFTDGCAFTQIQIAEVAG